MRKFLFYIAIWLMLLQAGPGSVYAQEGYGVYVPQNSYVFFSGDSAGIFSDVFIRGTLGTTKHTVLSFFGRVWENHDESILSDGRGGGIAFSGAGGTVRFAGTEPQLLRGGYNPVFRAGPVFSRIQIDNAAGIVLDRAATKVAGEFEFRKGRVFLSGQTMVVGNGAPGVIKGYDASRFFVTGTTPGSGLLMRERLKSLHGKVVFPLGPSPDRYTPAAIRMVLFNPEDIYMSVFSGTRRHLFHGDILHEETVQVTWEIGKRSGVSRGGSKLFLQHRFDDEGSVFRASRNYSYISRFSNGHWDTVPGRPPDSPGSLTTGRAIAGSGIHTRRIDWTKETIQYFAKMSDPYAVDSIRLMLSGIRSSTSTVNLFWFTLSSRRIDSFIVLRKKSDETGFAAIDTVAAGDGVLWYTLQDRNDDFGTSFYQLMAVDEYGRSWYSRIVAVASLSKTSMDIWPNPSDGHFKVRLRGYKLWGHILVWNAQGQLVHKEAVDERTVIPLHIWKPGGYVVGFATHYGQLIETGKLIIKPFE